MDTDLETELRELIARKEIYDRLMGYARGIDRNDGDLVQDTFWPDALVDHGHSKFRGEGIGAFFAEVSRYGTARQTHYIANVVMEIHGDEAITEGQHLYYAETARNRVDYTLTRVLRYIDRWERRAGTWRVFHRTVAETWNKIDPVKERFPADPGIIRSRGDRDDPSYALIDACRRGERWSLEAPDNVANTEHAAHRTDGAGFRARHD